MKEFELTPAMVLKYTPFSQKPEQFRKFLDLIMDIIKQASKENMCNYIEVVAVEAKFTYLLLQAHAEGEKLYKRLYEDGFAEKLEEEWVETALEDLSQFIEKGEENE